MSTSQFHDFTAADFNAVYEGGDFLPGAEIKGIPWDIGQAQPTVVDLEKAGRFKGQVLDIGCGLGDNAIFLAGRGYRVTAIDAASVAIERAKERAKGLDIEFAVADATSLVGYENRFDTVLDSALYHTMDEAGRRALVAACHRVTVPGAQLNLLSFADVPGGMPAPLSVSEQSVRSTLEEAGWAITDLRTAFFAGNASTTKKFLKSVDRAPEIDANGHTQLPIWMVQADRV